MATPTIKISRVESTEHSDVRHSTKKGQIIQLQRLMKLSGKLDLDVETPHQGDRDSLADKSPTSSVIHQPVITEAHLAGFEPASVKEDGTPTHVSAPPVKEISIETGARLNRLESIIKSAIDRSAKLFSVNATSTSSPRAESSMSYNLKVNAKYRTHIDEAPLRAEELRRELELARMELQEVKDIVREMTGIVEGMAAATDGGEESPTESLRSARSGRSAMVEDAVDEEDVGKLFGLGEKRLGDETLEERMRKASISSTAFV